MRIRHVLRGGSYFNGAGNLRAADRCGNEPVFRVRFFGFRIVVKLRRKP